MTGWQSILLETLHHLFAVNNEETAALDMGEKYIGTDKTQFTI